MNWQQIQGLLSQTVGGGTGGALQAGSAFTAAVESLQGALNQKAAGLGNFLGQFGLAGALKSASGAATSSSTSQEATLLASFKANWLYLVPIGLIVLVLLWRKR
jgi:hypothetical protein